MRNRNHGLMWAAVLLVSGVFLLLKNLGVFGPWGDLVWGAAFAVIGLGFLIWFAISVQQWWRAIPGFTLLSIGALVLLEWRQVGLGEWRSSLILFGVALGFWAALLVQADNWWATLPAGVLTLLGVLLGLQTQLSEAAWLATLFVGLGLVFALLYLLRLGKRNAWWPAIPAAALVLVGLVTWADSLGPNQIVGRYWPLLLLAAGLGLLAGALQRPAHQQPTKPAVTPAERPLIPPATETATTLAPAPTSGPAQPAGGEGPIDIYDFIKNQPAPAPPAPAPSSEPTELDLPPSLPPDKRIE